MKLSSLMRAAGVLAAVGIAVTAGVAYATVPTFSQTSITVSAGQSTTITTSNNIDPYVEANSTPTIATVAVNGTNVTFTGLAPGTSNVTLCGVGTATDCTNVVVNVQIGGGTSSSGGLSFSENGFSLGVGSTQTVTVSGGNGTYSISSISNGSVLSGSLSSNTLTVSGIASGTGTIGVCDTSSHCGTLTVNVGSSSSSNGSSISFSQNNFSLVTGASQTVVVSGGNGTYSVSNNSNNSAVATSISGNGITVYATSAGSATITVCDTSNDCGTLAVTVGSSSANQAVTFSVPSPTITAGQSLNVTLSGGSTGYVIFTNTTPSVIQASITSGDILSLYAENAGTDTIVVCATGGGCSPITVIATGGSSTTTTTTTTTPPTTTPPPTTTTTTGTVVANTALLTEIQALQTALTAALNQIQSIQTQLSQIEAQVSAGSGSGIGTNVSASASSGTFTELLTIGSQDSQVTALQNRLTALGFYSGPVTGYYGSLTAQAVTKYQTSQGITATGSVGPETRAALNGAN